MRLGGDFFMTGLRCVAKGGWGGGVAAARRAQRGTWTSSWGALVGVVWRPRSPWRSWRGGAGAVPQESALEVEGDGDLAVGGRRGPAEVDRAGRQAQPAPLGGGVQPDRAVGARRDQQPVARQRDVARAQRQRRPRRAGRQRRRAAPRADVDRAVIARDRDRAAVGGERDLAHRAGAVEQDLLLPRPG